MCISPARCPYIGRWRTKVAIKKKVGIIYWICLLEEGAGEFVFAVGFFPGEALAAAAEECLANWQTLQELAGIVTPFTERLEQEIRADVAAEHQADLDAQKKASEAEIREIKEKTQAEIASKIRSRLLQLASQKRD